MKIKIGILTISKSPVNFGANLQCFALWKYINSLENVDCKIIDLKRPCHGTYKEPKKIKFNSEYFDYTVEKKKLFPVKIKRLIKSFFPRRVPRKFKEFHELISYTKTLNIDDLYNVDLDFDIFITGSDQVWNCFQQYYVEPYFLTFTNKIKISYASSFGVSTIPAKYKKFVCSWLSSYKAVSVREETGKKNLSEMNKEPQICIDPVFLLSENEWKTFLQEKKITNDNYKFVYSLHYFDDFIETSKKIISKDNNITLEKKINNSSVVLNKIGPWEFLTLIRDAELIITDSFHCVAFSVLFRKNFIVIKDKTNNETFERIQNLLKITNLEEHIYSCEKEISELKIDIEFKELTEMILKSKEYLRRNIYDY